LIAIIACIGFAMLYSVAGASFSPWAGKQMIYFVAGMALLIAAAVTGIRFWNERRLSGLCGVAHFCSSP